MLVLEATPVVRKVKVKKQTSKAVTTVATTGQRAAIRLKMGGTSYAIVARRGSYRAANNPRTRLQTPYGGSGDQQADPWSRRIVRELSRDMDRNSDTYRSLMDDWVRAVAGEGVRALPRSKDQEWNKKVTILLHQKWKESGPDGLDIQNTRSMYELQSDFVRAVGVDGDAAMIKLSNGKIQFIEADQITSGTASMSSGIGSGVSTPGTLTYADGVEKDEFGAPTGFKIFSYEQNTGAVDLGKGHVYPPHEVEYVALKHRFSQTRGLPLIIAGLETWERIDSYKDSEVIAAEQGSLIYGAMEYPVGNMGYGTAYSPTSAQTNNDSQPPTAGFDGGFSPQNNNIDWHETNAGYILETPNGAKYTPINPQRPNKDCAPFLIEMIRQFCANAGLPYEIVFNDLRGLSWSVHRAMVQLARDKIGVFQQNKFSVPFGNVVKWQLARWIEEGLIEEVEDWDIFDLAFPQISWPDEGKEFEAQKIGLRSALTTRHKLFGPDWRNMLDESMTELIYASELVKAYCKEFPDFKLTPREFLGLMDHINETIDGGDELPEAGKGKVKNSDTEKKKPVKK
jgi:capsid protein